ncbi:hypothetical protein [Bifidobacterium ruminantium]|jgi:hypothetical protein|uniref:hypothetical protein n=1 Tax=Bifidobacterium ruminantium TaxID=78346 RepID=UPI001C230C3C|nr:hypothetical protein [Bifidobacterium ruminantium]MBU9112007.1 hypothetical protein [Bifidobacterium ruminantium]
MSNTNDSAKKPISKSAITAIVSAVTSIPLAFGRPVLAKFFCSIFVDVSIVFAVIALITVFGTRKHGSRALALSAAVLVTLVAIVLSMYVR